MEKQSRALSSLVLHADGVRWERLEIESGPGTRIGQIETTAKGPKKVLVMQEPGSDLVSNLTDILRLPNYPTSLSGAQH